MYFLVYLVDIATYADGDTPTLLGKTNVKLKAN